MSEQKKKKSSTRLECELKSYRTNFSERILNTLEQPFTKEIMLKSKKKHENTIQRWKETSV